jgi:uncharacterized Zn-binding protein involved in type VI secretion
MPAVARKGGTDTVDTVHGATGGRNCNASPTTTATDGGSGNVFVNSIGVVREGDAVAAHNNGSSCSAHAPGLASFSSNVFVNGLKLGRQNDAYGCGATITSGSSNVFAGG